MKLFSLHNQHNSPSRRTFLQQMTAAMSAMALSSPAMALSEKMHMPWQGDRKLGVALVGLGNYSSGQLAPALQETKLCRLAGIVTGTPSKAQEWTKKYNIPQKNIYDYKTFDRIADNKDIDIIYVVLPNSMHAEYVIRAAKAGKHVICEKPMATSVKDAQAMIDACKQANRLLSIGYRLHFEPHNQEAMRLGQQKVFGLVKLVESSFGFKIGDPKQWRLNKQLAGGGALMDVGVYAIQAARYVTGEEPVSVTAQEIKTDPVKFKEVDETLLWQLKFPSGAIANSSTSYATNVERLYAAAENGWFELSPVYGYGKPEGRTSKGPMNFPKVNHQAMQMDDFARCVKENKPSSVSGEEGLKDMKVLAAIYKAVESGKTVQIS
jgi:predicted dehydrogenase